MLDAYHIQLTGPSGSGKTYMAESLRALGYPAIDGDVIDNLGCFLDSEGQAHEYDHDGGQEWLETHFWSWDEAALDVYLRSNRRAIICGGAANDKAMGNRFNQIFYLELSKGEILANLLSPERFNPFGRTKEQQEFASKMVDNFYANIPSNWIPLHSREAGALLSEMESHLGDELGK